MKSTGQVSSSGLGEISDSKSYKTFRSSFALHQIEVDDEGAWKYYDGGPKDVPPLICLPGASGTVDSFFRQFSLCAKGYRIIAAQFPSYLTFEEWLHGFDAFLAHIGVNTFHFLGVSLGGFLAQVYTMSRPNRVLSLILCNSFCSTALFAEHAPAATFFQFMPFFYLKDYLLSSFAKGMLESEVADSVDFAVEQIDTLSRAELAARLSLNCTEYEVRKLRIADENITMIDSLDRVARPAVLRDQLYAQYPNARKAFLKTGGDFPCLSRADEVNVYIQVHLRALASQESILLPEEEAEVTAAVAAARVDSPPRSKPAAHYGDEDQL